MLIYICFQFYLLELFELECFLSAYHLLIKMIKMKWGLAGVDDGMWHLLTFGYHNKFKHNS